MRSRWLCVVLMVMFAACGARAAHEWNVLDAGAVGDGKTDCTAVFQKLLDEAGKAGGGVVTAPAGRYMIKGNLVVPADVTFQGTYHTYPMVREWQLAEPRGSTLLAYAGRGSNEGEPFVRLNGDAAAIAGFIIMYPEWKMSDVPPIAYPPCIMAQNNDNAAITDCNILNAYEAIRLISAHRHIVRNVLGYPSWRGMFIDECYDVGRVENVHFCPIAAPYNEDNPYSMWINTNGIAFEFGRTDWQYLLNTFCLGYGIAYKFDDTPRGSCNGNFLGIGADACARAVVIEQAPSFGVLITNGEFVGRWGKRDSVGVDIGPKCTGVVSFTNCSFWGAYDSIIRMRAPGGRFNATACNFVDWDASKIGSPAVDIEAGRAVIQGNIFHEGETHVRIGKKAVSAIISANLAEGGIVVKNFAGGRAVIQGNQGPPVALDSRVKENYTVGIGSDYDRQFVRRWQGPESAGEWKGVGTKRWSTKGSELILPVLPGRQYTVAIEVAVPQYAIDPSAGLYYGKTRILKFDKPGALKLSGVLPASKAGQVTLSVKCKNWVPKQAYANTGDDRVLGVAVRSITLKAKGTAVKQPVVVTE